MGYLPRSPAVPRSRLPSRVRPTAALQGAVAGGRRHRPLLGRVHKLRRVRVLGERINIDLDLLRLHPAPAFYVQYIDIIRGTAFPDHILQTGRDSSNLLKILLGLESGGAFSAFPSIGLIQGARKKYADFVKQQPGRARQNS